jgi:N-acyl-D-amino-acid deacylase
MSAWTLAGATVVDGSGAPPYVADVVIEDDRIAAVGDGERRGTVIDASGLLATPGFVDIHSHLDWIAPLPNGPELLAPNVQQGITTSVAGNCGISPAPVGEFVNRGALEQMLLVGLVTEQLGWRWSSVREYLDEVERRGLPLNLAVYVGHSTLRSTVIGELHRQATPTEQARMRALLEEGLRDGAVGLSVGLEYFPGRYAGPSEIEDLCRVAAAHDGLVAVHTRGISELFDPAMDEALRFGTSSGCRLQLAHVNPMGRANWDAIDGLFSRVDAARAGGLDVAFDIIGYTAWTMTVFETLPHVVAELGLDAVLALAGGPGRTHLRELVERARPEWPPWVENRVTRNVPLEMGWDALYLADAPAGFEDAKGETLAAIARQRQADGFDVYCDVMVASRGAARIVNDGYGGDSADDEPLRRLVARPDAIPETDTVPVVVDGRIALPLPLFWGTMPRFLARFSRDLELLALEHAVARITSVPARQARLGDRGELREGAFADVLLLDLANLGDRGTMLDPEPAGGVEWVFVNGEPVVTDGVYDPSRLPGRSLRRSTQGVAAAAAGAASTKGGSQ